MLRIIHTGRAYEVQDLAPWRTKLELARACREVRVLKALLRRTERKLRATKLELKSCQKSTLNT